jgi:hypothetical protein
MCPNFQALKKNTIKDKFPIFVIGDLLAELSGAQFFTKLDLHFGYHQIHMKEVYIPKLDFKPMKAIMSSWSCPSESVTHPTFSKGS